MSEKPNTKNQRDKTLFELINDLRKDEKVYLRFLVVSMILECLIFIPLCNLIGTSYFEPFIQYIFLIGNYDFGMDMFIKLDYIELF